MRHHGQLYFFLMLWGATAEMTKAVDESTSGEEDDDSKSINVKCDLRVMFRLIVLVVKLQL